jgi:hypothetical protein
LTIHIPAIAGALGDAALLLILLKAGSLELGYYSSISMS